MAEKNEAHGPGRAARSSGDLFRGVGEAPPNSGGDADAATEKIPPRVGQVVLNLQPCNLVTAQCYNSTEKPKGAFSRGNRMLFFRASSVLWESSDSFSQNGRSSLGEKRNVFTEKTTSFGKKHLGTNQDNGQSPRTLMTVVQRCDSARSDREPVNPTSDWPRQPHLFSDRLAGKQVNRLTDNQSWEGPCSSSSPPPHLSGRPYIISDKWQSSLFLKVSHTFRGQAVGILPRHAHQATPTEPILLRCKFVASAASTGTFPGKRETEAYPIKTMIPTLAMFLWRTFQDSRTDSFWALERGNASSRSPWLPGSVPFASRASAEPPLSSETAGSAASPVLDKVHPICSAGFSSPGTTKADGAATGGLHAVMFVNLDHFKEFWELKSRRLKVVKIDKHRHSDSLQNANSTAVNVSQSSWPSFHPEGEPGCFSPLVQPHRLGVTLLGNPAAGSCGGECPKPAKQPQNKMARAEFGGITEKMGRGEGEEEEEEGEDDDCWEEEEEEEDCGVVSELAGEPGLVMPPLTSPGEAGSIWQAFCHKLAYDEWLQDLGRSSPEVSKLGNFKTCGLQLPELKLKSTSLKVAKFEDPGLVPGREGLGRRGWVNLLSKAPEGRTKKNKWKPIKESCGCSTTGGFEEETGQSLVWNACCGPQLPEFPSQQFQELKSTSLKSSRVGHPQVLVSCLSRGWTKTSKVPSNSVFSLSPPCVCKGSRERLLASPSTWEAPLPERRKLRQASTYQRKRGCWVVQAGEPSARRCLLQGEKSKAFPPGLCSVLSLFPLGSSAILSQVHPRRAGGAQAGILGILKPAWFGSLSPSRKLPSARMGQWARDPPRLPAFQARGDQALLAPKCWGRRGGQQKGGLYEAGRSCTRRSLAFPAAWEDGCAGLGPVIKGAGLGAGRCRALGDFGPEQKKKEKKKKGGREGGKEEVREREWKKRKNGWKAGRQRKKKSRGREGRERERKKERKKKKEKRKKKK
ncbi:Nop9, partial [Ophiophagus hannah]